MTRQWNGLQRQLETRLWRSKTQPTATCTSDTGRTRVQLNLTMMRRKAWGQPFNLWSGSEYQESIERR